jgi:hypothetical protein
VNGATVPLPPPIKPANGARVVFVKFQKARHRLTIDVAKRTTTVESEILFEVPQYGRPILDVTPAAGARADYFVNGQKVLTAEISAPKCRRDSDRSRRSACFRYVNEAYEAGVYSAHICYELAERESLGVTWGQDGVTCFLGMSDYKAACGRHFLERYLPANPEYDRHPVQLDVELVSTRKEHVVLANGAVTGDLATRFSVEFPEWYSASCPFFFLAPRDEVVVSELLIDGAGRPKLPVTVFAAGPDRADVALDRYVELIKNNLPDIERDLGPFPHERLVVFAGQKGMEYAGAVTCSEANLVHELVHCYFGRSVLPVNGDSGWIDEAVANWYTATPEWKKGGSQPLRRNIGALSPYRRETVELHGLHGRNFLRYLDKESNRELLGFLKKLHEKFARAQLDSRQLQYELEQLIGRPLGDEFDRCVYGLKPLSHP